MAVEISEGEFEKEVLQSGKTVLVYFHLPSCAKCATWNNVAERPDEGYRGEGQMGEVERGQ